MKVQVQVQPQQQIQESTSQQQSVQQNTEQQIVQVCVFIITLCCGFLLNLFSFILVPLKFSIYLFSGPDPRSATRSDAGSGPPSALWLPSTASRCNNCTTDSAWGTHRGAAPTGALKETCTHSQHHGRIANFVRSQNLSIVTSYRLPPMCF